MNSKTIPVPAPRLASHGVIAPRPVIPDMTIKPEIEVMQEIRRLADSEERKPVPLDAGLPFHEVLINLADSRIVDYGLTQDVPGYCLIYRREGSAPGGRLNLNFGGTLYAFYPGQRLKGWFNNFSISRHADSATVGNAKLLIVKSKDADWYEPEVPAAIDAVTLLGTAATTLTPPVMQSITLTAGSAAAPNGANPTGKFDPTGFTNLRVLVDSWADGSNNGTTFSIVPWYQDVSGQWYSQETAQIDVPTGQRFRDIIVPVVGKGPMFLQVINMAGTPGVPAAVGLCVQGVS